MTVRFVPDSFYIVIDGLRADCALLAAKLIKTNLEATAQIRVRGPLALPTERRRHMHMREMVADGDKKGLYVSQPKRFRRVLLVIKPTSAAIRGLISVPLPKSVNVRIEPYQDQYDLKDDLS
jgi:ribosomal protein S10